MNIFSYESKVSQVLMFVADLCILNLCFILCCLPIFTIGAAQAALYSGIRTLQDPEDDSSPAKAFFKAFKVGFGSITLAWLAFFVVEILLGFALWNASLQKLDGGNAPYWISIIGLAIVMLLHAQIPLFHARFTCSAGQLIRNSFFLVIAHPLRSILAAALIWAPLATTTRPSFMFISLAFILLYYGVVFLLNFNIMKKPFKTLIDHYNETHDEDGIAIIPSLDEEEEEEES